MIEANINIKDILEEDKIKKEEEIKQEELKRKHKIKKDDVYIVEKKSLIATLIKTLSSLIRVIFSIIFIGLASIGLLSLVYQNPRTEILNLLKNLFADIVSFVS